MQSLDMERLIKLFIQKEIRKIRFCIPVGLNLKPSKGTDIAANTPNRRLNFKLDVIKYCSCSVEYYSSLFSNKHTMWNGLIHFSIVDIVTVNCTFFS